MRNLQRERFFDPRNPRGTLFRAGSLIGSNTPLYYLAHENPYQRSCWGKRDVSRLVFQSIYSGPEIRILRKISSLEPAGNVISPQSRPKSGQFYFLMCFY